MGKRIGIEGKGLDSPFRHENIDWQGPAMGTLEGRSVQEEGIPGSMVLYMWRKVSVSWRREWSAVSEASGRLSKIKAELSETGWRRGHYVLESSFRGEQAKSNEGSRK